MIAQGGQVARCVVSHSVHPAFPPDFPEDVLVDTANEVAPKVGRLTALGKFLFRNELRETSAAFINYLGEPLREISFCLLNGAYP
jgi:hypothetical protein